MHKRGICRRPVSVCHARELRQNEGRMCSVSRVHSRSGDRCGPRILNNLPASLQDKEVVTFLL